MNNLASLDHPLPYLAHSQNDGGNGVDEPLADHLRQVADLAARFATPFGGDQQAYAAGLLHDLGKYADQFQRRVRGLRERGRDHWTVGAGVLAASAKELGLVAALAVAGHHTGLGHPPLHCVDYCRNVMKALIERPDDFTSADRALLWQRFQADGFALPAIRQGLVLSEEGQFAADLLDVRMLFSALVDADFLETEAHFSGDAATPRRPRPAGPAIDLNLALEALERDIARVAEQFRDSPITAARQALLQWCINTAQRSRGIFTLSAPTGAGKTLAMLAFALHHARIHGLRRVILVVPFLNIIDQTAGVYRRIFSEENGFNPATVLEHHSLAHSRERPGDASSDGEAEDSHRLMSENWDAPVILTTTVQFFESLMADRPSRCRKLHRLAQSVILFDEVQTLPPKLAVATLATLSRLAAPDGPYRSTVVFATATQPAFDVLHERITEKYCRSGWRPVEIVPDARSLFTTAAARVRVTWRHATPLPLADLAQEIRKQRQALCIVNLKRHAVELARALEERGAKGLLHLSTNMCPAHRLKVLEEVNQRLSEGLPVRLVATQCVEAGVDLDFPVVYRALAPLEAIAQAAGRCNRHGRGPRGEVVVFNPQDDRKKYPPGYGAGVSATEAFLGLIAEQFDLDTVEILGDPERLRAYFRMFYSLSGRTTSMLDDEEPLLRAICEGDFAEVARLYRLIPQDTINVLVPYDKEAFDQLRTELADTVQWTLDKIRDWFRRASFHAVGLFRPAGGASIWNQLEPVSFSRRRVVENHEAEWFLPLAGLEYDRLTGISQRMEDAWIA